jgi:hypothetical protein
MKAIGGLTIVFLIDLYSLAEFDEIKLCLYDHLTKL